MRITPFDAETQVMLESLTGKKTILFVGEKDFAIRASYSKHNDVDYINAIIEAVRGRVGVRYVGVDDNPDKKFLTFHIEYDSHKYPEQIGDYGFCERSTINAAIYVNSNGEEIKAIQVRDDNAANLREFVGNGKLVIETEDGGKIWFEFINNGVFVNAEVGAYILEEKNGHFAVWKKRVFERLWTKK